MALEPRRTKIVATIGPASSSPGVLEQLMQTIDGARLNFSHGTRDDHARTAGLIRAAQDRLGRPVAVIADLQGPKLRVGELAAPVELVRGEHVTIAGEDGAQPDDLPVAPDVLGSILLPGNDVLIDDGAVRLRVEKVDRGRAHCEVLVGGTGQLAQGRQPPRRARCRFPR